ncbi:hypothetical protein P9112_011026 [Eukaryota sp. TZLM1-RC]
MDDLYLSNLSQKELESRVNVLQNEVDNAQEFSQNITDLMVEIRKNNGIPSRILTEIEILKSLIPNNPEGIEDQSTLLAEKEQENAKLLEELHSVSQEKQEFADNLSKFEAIINDLEQKIGEKDEEIATLQAESLELENSQQLNVQNCSKFESIIDEKSALLAEKEQENAKLLEELHSVSQEKQQLEELLQQNSSADFNFSKNLSPQNLMKFLTDFALKTENSVDTLRQKMDDLYLSNLSQKELESRVNVLQNEVDNAQEFSQNITDLMVEIRKNNGIPSRILTEIEILKSLIPNNPEGIEDQSTLLAEKEQENAKLLEELHSVSQEKQEFADNLSKFEAIINDLEQKIGEKDEEIASLQAESLELENSQQLNVQNCSKFESIIDEKSALLAEKEQENAKLLEELHSVSQEKQQLEELLQQNSSADFNFSKNLSPQNLMKFLTDFALKTENSVDTLRQKMDDLYLSNLSQKELESRVNVLQNEVDNAQEFSQNITDLMVEIRKK